MSSWSQGMVKCKALITLRPTDTKRAFSQLLEWVLCYALVLTRSSSFSCLPKLTIHNSGLKG